MQDLRKHLKDAIEINQTRMPLYAEASNGQTLKFSKKLIKAEKWALWGTHIFDNQGDKLQSRGIPYIKSEFVDMKHTPSFSLHYPPSIDFTRPHAEITIDSLKKDLKKKIQTKNHDGIVVLCDDHLQRLDSQLHVYCMLRHLLESMRRIAYMIPFHHESCKNQNIVFPEQYSYYLLKIHLLLLKPSKSLDENVVPIQQKGIPFLFQDFPHIPKVPASIEIDK